MEMLSETFYNPCSTCNKLHRTSPRRIITRKSGKKALYAMCIVCTKLYVSHWRKYRRGHQVQYLRAWRARQKMKALFNECETCRAKPGTPDLCAGCIANRWMIWKLEELLVESMYQLGVCRPSEAGDHKETIKKFLELHSEKRY